MWGHSSFHGSLFSLELSPPLGDPSCFPCILAANEEASCASRAFLVSWNEVMDTRLENRGRWRTSKKETTKNNRNKKTHHVPKLPQVLQEQVFLEGEQWAVWAVLVLESNKHVWGLVTPSGDTVPSAGYIQRCFLTFRRCSCSKKSSFQEGLARWDGLSQDPKPSGFSTAVQTHALPADYGSFPEWLSILFVEEFSGPGEGKGPGWHRATVGRVSMKNAFCKRGGKRFGFPWSMGHHRSWYSKCLLHCTSLWKKIVCWKVSKQTLYSIQKFFYEKSWYPQSA